MPNVPMHRRMIRASEDAAVITLCEAAGMLTPPEPDPLNIALRADSDPGAIREIANELTNGTNRLNTGSSNLINAVTILATAWKGRRHQTWNSHAGAVMDYYKPSARFLRRSKPGLWALADKTARATAAIGADLDTATMAVATALIDLANLVIASSVAVTKGNATPEDELTVRQAVAGVQNALVEFEQTVAEAEQEYLVTPNLVTMLQFSDEGAGMANDPTEDNLLRIQFPNFEDALAQLAMSVTQASLASEDFSAAGKITSINGQSPFGTSATASVLRLNWIMAVAWRISETDEAQTQTKQLKTTAQQARDDYLQVEQRNTDSFTVIYPD